MKDELLVIGDSHSAALFQAAQAQGYGVDLLYISGNHWHENRMLPDRRCGISAAWRPGIARRVQEFAAPRGGRVFAAGMPVLTSAGYHLGRLAPLLQRQGGAVAAEQLSEAFLCDWLAHHRGRLWRILRLAASSADLIVVAPPVVQENAVVARLAGLITAELRHSGLRVFDPREEPDWMAAPLPMALRAADGVHGTADYGAAVLARLQQRGWLAGCKTMVAAQ